MGMILRIASSRIVGQGDIVGRSGYFSLNLSANSVMRGRLDARRTLKSLVADLRIKEFVEKKSEGSMSCEEQSLYRNLRKFLNLGIVAYDSKRVSKGPDRKYYYLTELGKELFQHFVERNIKIFTKESIINLLN